MKIPTMKLFCLLCLTGILHLTGCQSSDPEMEAYKANMNQFFENISYYDTTINAIDPESETAVSELLGLLDSMSELFNQMAELVVPPDFIGIEELSDEASTYMTEAVSLYHQLLEADYYNVNIANAAKENYDRANLRLQYILSILHGDIPEEIIVYEDENTEEGQTEDRTAEEGQTDNEAGEDEHTNGSIDGNQTDNSIIDNAETDNSVESGPSNDDPGATEQ